MNNEAPSKGSPLRTLIETVGRKALMMLDSVGGVWLLLVNALSWILRSLREPHVRLGRAAIVSQIVRVGVRSILIVSLVSFSVGFILALQMAPTLTDLGQVQLVPDIVVVAVVRELAPLIAAIVMTGFAGAAITAEIGTMVVGEEVEALEAHALNPVRFLVVPRIIAVTVSLTAITVLANLVAVGSGMIAGVAVLDIPMTTYISSTIARSSNADFLTGIAKSSVFGLLIGSIACLNGLRVTGGAAGVGHATTSTVVESIVSIIIADLIFTAAFYSLGLV